MINRFSVGDRVEIKQGHCPWIHCRTGVVAAVSPRNAWIDVKLDDREGVTVFKAVSLEKAGPRPVKK